MAPVFLFIFYFFVLLFFLYKIVQRNGIGLGWRETAAFFSVKIMAGCLYGYIFLHTYHGDDTWNFFNDSLPEYQKMIHQPGIFFRDFLPWPAFGAAENFWQGMARYFTDLEYWLTVKLLALFNIFSRGNYYIDVLFFNFLVSLGPLLLFRLMLSIFPARKRLLIIVIFFIPSITFWLSGIRAEGLLLLFIALILFYTDRWFNQRRVLYFFWIMLGMIGFLLFRSQALFIFLPAYCCWTLSRKAGPRAIYYFVFAYAGGLLILLASLLISPGKNLASPIANRQAAFFRLHGNTRFGLDTLKPTFSSMVRILPQAFNNTFLRPYPWEARGWLQWLSALEVIALWALVLLFLLSPFQNRKWVVGHPLMLCFLFYGISQILLIGFIVPFPGAIVRYKAIPELFIVTALTLGIKPGFFKLQ